MDPNELLSEIAKRHHVLLSHDDPALVLGTILEAHLKRANKQYENAIEEAVARITAATAQAESTARAKAEAVVTQAAEFAATRIRQAGDDAAAKVAGLLQDSPSPSQRSVSSKPTTFFWAMILLIAGFWVGWAFGSGTF
jgi:hypothetical protein